MLRLPIKFISLSNAVKRTLYYVTIKWDEFRKIGKIRILGEHQVDFCELWKTKFVTFKSHNGVTDCWLLIIGIDRPNCIDYSHPVARLLTANTNPNTWPLPQGIQEHEGSPEMALQE